MARNFIIFAGTANRDLASAIARELNTTLGLAAVENFPDGETTVRLEEPVRGREVFIVQPTSPPVNDHLLELLAFADACRRASAARITAVVPYFGYARADKRHGRREPITASMIADLMQTVGIDHLITLDLHAPQIEGFFRIPVDSLTAVPTLARALRDRVPDDAVVVSPDTGRVHAATMYAHRLKTSVVVLHKQRASGTETRITHVVGDVRDRACVIVDDMISTGGTMAESIEALLAAGARPEFTLVATHGLFLPGARAKLDHPSVRAVVVTDSVEIISRDWPQLEVVSIAPLIAEAIRHTLINGAFDLA
ncbi:ribose-phosphate diphosphokinase [Pyrinomonas methylaliphatogenes]|uniref:Ribose-phosphate pyrophosphokinase n=1 Tax=Pyrinomonas methylaliphatogenes TaxID=454194 RepID=A0A0B6X1F3_9BACT|nr:ribose-phosphate pyrophosphokinase [Pyrinomonas methylaliphatogenes]CDM67121.1 ribose-phosphate pyrophosphokinase [Pyrinomonas methylaliphatogenes]